jgi:stage V sporulation protein G
MTALSFTDLDSPTAQKKGYFLFMPGRKMADGAYVDIVHPLNNETRQMIQEKVVEEYERIIREYVK